MILKIHKSKIPYQKNKNKKLNKVWTNFLVFLASANKYLSILSRPYSYSYVLQNVYP